MKGLAGFAMGGRGRAMLLAIATAGSLLFAWIAAALVALVTLRKGFAEGLQLLLWASLPGLILARVTGDASVFALVVGTGALAFTLRATGSLALTALAGVGVALLTAVLMASFGEVLLDELVRIFGEFLAALEAQQAREGAGDSLNLQRPTPLQIAGMLGTANGTLSFLCLVLGRYWQAALYNPGGFGAEFRALRFPPALVWLLAIAGLAVAALGFSWRSWAAAFMLPLTVGGFALLHARVEIRGRGRGWMGAIYVAWVVFDAAKLALIGLVLADTWLDFRRRWSAARDADQSGADQGGVEEDSTARLDDGGLGTDGSGNDESGAASRERDSADDGPENRKEDPDQDRDKD